MNKNINEIITNMVNTIKFFNWKLTQVWVENNIIYVERIRTNGQKKDEALFQGDNNTPEFTYNILNKLKYVLNFNRMLNNDNIMI
jgi:hypothetical protein